MASYTIWLISSKAIKKAARNSDGRKFLVAFPRVPVIYHCLPETINLNCEGFEDPLS